MIQFTQYYGRFDDVRGSLFSLPHWARVIVGLAAIPGLVLLLLSLLAFAVSLLALLLLTVPVYAVLRRVAVRRTAQQAPPGVRRVQATVVE